MCYFLQGMWNEKIGISYLNSQLVGFSYYNVIYMLLHRCKFTLRWFSFATSEQPSSDHRVRYVCNVATISKQLILLLQRCCSNILYDVVHRLLQRCKFTLRWFSFATSEQPSSDHRVQHLCNVAATCMCLLGTHVVLFLKTRCVV